MSETVVLKIEGMNCMHCKMKVEKALATVAGVTGVTVDLTGKRAEVNGRAERAALVEAVAKSGYKVVS